MKRILTLLLILIGMTLSFAVIGLIVLFATGTVNNLQDVSNLLAGRKFGEEAISTTSQPEKTQDALQLLTQHQNELEQTVSTLQQKAETLKNEQAKLQEDLNALQNQQGDQGTENAQKRAERKAETVALFNQMRPADAAAIMDNLGDDLVLELITEMDGRQGARILSALANEQRKAKLIEQFLQNKK